MSTRTNITIAQAEDWVCPVSLAGPDGDALDLHGWTWAASLRQRPGAAATAITVAVTDETEGEIELSLSATETAGLAPGNYLWGLAGRDSNGRDWQLVAGTAVVEATSPRFP